MLLAREITCESTPNGFRRRGVVLFDNETRTLQGQKGMVDAVDSPLLQKIGKSSLP